ncbi:MAG: aminotransferase class I/II-fold pyridoxal phosphate-dependent enzyme [Phycisphaerales bacterium]|nr:aminotransferase class I/II-fold pyridoxal phosphate-dependent enzyme [Phycisphaerales bacterium]
MHELIADRASAIDASGIRRIFALAGTLDNPINLSIGQPDFPVPAEVRAAASDAIEQGHNGYAPTQGHPVLVERICAWLKADLGWSAPPVGTADHDGALTMVTSGTSGALLLAYMALLNPGDECILSDPYFVSYPHLATMCGAKAVLADTYPDFKLTAARVEPLITDKTKFVLLNTPSNPAGVTLTQQECNELRELCVSRGVLLISDEIYDEFVFSDGLTESCAQDPSIKRLATPARIAGASDDVLLIRGFGKTYGCTGWRLGYASGPRAVIDEMSKLQQYTFVCAPAPLQIGAAACFDADMRSTVADYETRRNMVIDKLGSVTNIATPSGAFYAFIEVPERLGMSGTQFAEKLVESNVLVIPGSAFSARDTHFRISFATDPKKLAAGLDIIADAMK